MSVGARILKWQILTAYAAPKLPTPTSDQQLSWNNVWISYGNNAKGQRWSPDHIYDPVKLDVSLQQYTTPEMGTLQIDITRIDGSPCWAEPILWSTTKQNSELPEYPNIVYTTVDVSGFTADPGHQYRIRCYPIGTWYYWDGHNWQVDPAGGRFEWFLWSGPDRYSRGAACTNCNINGHSGAWIESLEGDMVFRLYEIL